MKKRFYIYASWEETFELLTIEERATMLMNLFRYQRGEEPILDTSGLKITWSSIKYLLESDNKKYEIKLETIKQNSKSNPKLGNNVPNTGYVPNTNKSLLDIGKNKLDIGSPNDNVNVNVNVNDNVNGNVVIGSDWGTMFRQGETPKSLFPKYPSNRHEITSSWMEYIG